MGKIERKSSFSTDHINMTSMVATNAARAVAYITAISSGMAAVVDKFPQTARDRVLKGGAVVLGITAVGMLCDIAVDKIHGNNLY